MKARTVALVAATAGAAAGVVWWRRRSSRAPAPAVRLGLSDGAVLTLDRSDPSTTELETLAAGVRDSFPGGA